MDRETARNLLSITDHTLLSRTATEKQIFALCDEALEYKTASVCIPPCFVRAARSYGKDLCVCTVIGFPNGYSATSVKAFEASAAVADGADEIDMVINTNLLRDGKDSAVLAEINEVKLACEGRLLKVITEMCLLTPEEKARVCRIVSASDADFIKTSTGFSTSGATREDIAMMKSLCVGKKVKAAGGIKSVKDAADFVALGADRLGTSSLVRLLREEGLI